MAAKIIVTALATALLLGSAASAQGTGEAFPSRPITMLVGSEAGSAPDVLARLLQQDMREGLGQSLVVENRPGGGAGGIAASMLARARPDGYTVHLATVVVAIAPAMGPQAVNPMTEFAAIGHVASVPLILVVNPSLNVKSVAEFIALAKTQPGKMNYGTPGVGSLQNLTTEMLKRVAGIDLVHVPYKSGGAAVNAVLANEAHMFFAGMPPALPHVQSGKLTALAVSTAKRSASAPNVLTVAEAGLLGFEADNWHALYAPAGTPAPVIAKLNAELNRVLNLPQTRERMLRVGAEPRPGTPEDLAQHTRIETEKWVRVVKESVVKLE